MKVGLDQVLNCVEVLGHLAGVIDFPVPPNSNMRKTAGNTITGNYGLSFRLKRIGSFLQRSASHRSSAKPLQ